MKNDNGTILYEDGPSICSFSSVVGKKEVHHDFLWDGERTEGIER